MSDRAISASERARRQFNRQADAYADNEVVADRALLDFVVALVDPRPEERVLDVACGPAFLTLALAERAQLAVGVDVTDRFLARARREARGRGLANVALAQCDVASLPFADRSFGAASCKFALHHFARPEQVIAEMTRVVQPGGRIVLLDMLTSDDSAKAAMHDRIERLCDPSHVRALTESELDAIVAGSGLRVLARRKGEAIERFGPWLAHGGPPPEAAREIERLLRDSIASDRTGLQVREEQGELVFTHTGITLLLETPPTG